MLQVNVDLFKMYIGSLFTRLYRSEYNELLFALLLLARIGLCTEFVIRNKMCFLHISYWLLAKCNFKTLIESIIAMINERVMILISYKCRFKIIILRT